mgnify:CR=1 FL=1
MHDGRYRIQIARDAAFAFLYPANLDLLRAMGHESDLYALTIDDGLNKERLPSLKGIMAAKKKPVEVLTLADTNEEAANSQALSTRQSIAVSALALANQSQQSVLQLLR